MIQCVNPELDVKLAQASPLELVACAVLLDTDDRVLLSTRPEGKRMAGLWEIPGGKIEENEAPEIALKRELKEELDIDISTGCLAPFGFISHRFDDRHVVLCIFGCRNWEGEMRAMENQEFKWVRLNEISQYPMPSANEGLIHIIRKNL